MSWVLVDISWRLEKNERNLMKRIKNSAPMFLFNDDGKKTGVLLKIADFERMMDELEDYADYKMIKERSKKSYTTYTREEVLAELAGGR